MKNKEATLQKAAAVLSFNAFDAFWLFNLTNVNQKD